MEEITLVRDFAIIMIVAGAVTLLFRRLHQPPILGYLISGLLIGPYTLPVPPVTDVHTVKLLADLGLVLLLFGLGLEFSWSKIREVGSSVLIIGVIEIFTMIGLGYGLGRLLNWTPMDSFFLGAALHISSSALIVKILRDMGKLNLLSSRLIVGILVVEDFAAVALIALLSGIATTGAVDFAGIGSLILRLLIFTVASLAFGTLIVPRIINFTRQFRSKEALLITSLGLCFALALLSRYLGLSVAAGAFLMGALIGDTNDSEEIIEIVTPVRDVFAALFFITIGMLINITQVSDFIVPAIIVAVVFMLGKILSNTLATFICGHDPKTSLQVGMGMPQMGEFSLAISKMGVDRGAVVAPIYSVIAVATALTCFVAPYITRSVDYVANFFAYRTPASLKTYVAKQADWLYEIRSTFNHDSETARRIQHSVKVILINILIVIVIIGIGTFTLELSDNLADYTHIRTDIVALFLGFVTIILCIPSLVTVWRGLHTMIDEAALHMLNRRVAATKVGHMAIRTALRDSILIVLSVFVLLWLIPLMARLFFFGSFAIAVPVLLLAVFLVVVIASVRQLHGLLERTFGQVLLGEEYVPTSSEVGISDDGQRRIAKLFRRMRFPGSRKERRSKKVKQSGNEEQNEPSHTVPEESNDVDSKADNPNR